MGHALYFSQNNILKTSSWSGQWLDIELMFFSVSHEYLFLEWAPIGYWIDVYLYHMNIFSWSGQWLDIELMFFCITWISLPGVGTDWILNWCLSVSHEYLFLEWAVIGYWIDVYLYHMNISSWSGQWLDIELMFICITWISLPGVGSDWILNWCLYVSHEYLFLEWAVIGYFIDVWIDVIAAFWSHVPLFFTIPWKVYNNGHPSKGT